jgi:hypothetical protein
MAEKLTLSEPEQRVLEAILNRSMIGGAELMNHTDMIRPDELIKIVRSLHANNLIEVSGDVLNEKMLPYATFGIRPSAREYLMALLRQQA